MTFGNSMLQCGGCGAVVTFCDIFLTFFVTFGNSMLQCGGCGAVVTDPGGNFNRGNFLPAPRNFDHSHFLFPSPSSLLISLLCSCFCILFLLLHYLFLLWWTLFVGSLCHVSALSSYLFVLGCLWMIVAWCFAQESIFSYFCKNYFFFTFCKSLLCLLFSRSFLEPTYHIWLAKG